MIKNILNIACLTFTTASLAVVTPSESAGTRTHLSNPPEFVSMEPISMPEITEDDINNQGVSITDLLKGKTTDKDPDFKHGILITESSPRWEIFVNGKWETPAANLKYWVDPKDLETNPLSELILKKGFTVYGADQRIRFRPDSKNGEVSTLKFTLVDLLDLKQTDGKWQYTEPVDGILKEYGTLGETKELTKNSKKTLFMEGFEFYVSPKSINLTIKVKDVNDAPRATKAINNNYIIDSGSTKLRLKGLSVTDMDKNETLIVSMKLRKPKAGSLSVPNGAAYNSRTGIWSITGSEFKVNSALKNITYTATAGFTDTQLIDITINDDNAQPRNQTTGTIRVTFSKISFSALEDDKEGKSLLKSELETAGTLDIQEANIDLYQELLLDSITALHDDKELIQEVIDEVNAGRDIIFNRLYNGWNLISSPFEGWSPDTIMKKYKFLRLYCFGFNHDSFTYYKSELNAPLKVGKAYWLYVHIPQSKGIDFIDYNLKGNFTDKELNFKVGWNFIGPTQPLQSPAVNPSTQYDWDSHYEWDSEGGGGYWIYSRSRTAKKGLPTFYKLGKGYWVFYLSNLD